MARARNAGRDRCFWSSTGKDNGDKVDVYTRMPSLAAAVFFLARGFLGLGCACCIALRDFWSLRHLTIPGSDVVLSLGLGGEDVVTWYGYFVFRGGAGATEPGPLKTLPHRAVSGDRWGFCIASRFARWDPPSR